MFFARNAFSSTRLARSKSSCLFAIAPEADGWLDEPPKSGTSVGPASSKPAREAIFSSTPPHPRSRYERQSPRRFPEEQRPPETPRHRANSHRGGPLTPERQKPARAPPLRSQQGQWSRRQPAGKFLGHPERKDRVVVFRDQDGCAHKMRSVAVMAFFPSPLPEKGQASVHP